MLRARRRRCATVTFDLADLHRFQVVLSGPWYKKSPVFMAGLVASGSAHVAVSVERRQLSLGKDFGWVAVPGAKVTDRLRARTGVALKDAFVICGFFVDS